MALQTPIAFIVFNRPELTQLVFNQIALAKPQVLLVIGDGPRSSHPDDSDKVATTRAIIQQVDWPCKVLTNFADTNMGCKYRVSSGLSWVFEQTEQAIVLEDDCIPDPSFFIYCEAMLDRFRNDDRIVAISGNNFQTGQRWGTDSYFFSKYFHCWGWATWRRSWKNFDSSITSWPKFQTTGGMTSLADSSTEDMYWTKIMDQEYRCEIDSWAYAFLYMCWAQGQLTILPNTNLVSNIGFGEDGTHTKNINEKKANFPIENIGPLRHPTLRVRDKAADRYIFTNYFEGKRIHGLKWLRRRLRHKRLSLRIAKQALAGKDPPVSLQQDSNLTRQVCKIGISSESVHQAENVAKKPKAESYCRPHSQRGRA